MKFNMSNKVRCLGLFGAIVAAVGLFGSGVEAIAVQSNTPALVLRHASAAAEMAGKWQSYPTNYALATSIKAECSQVVNMLSESWVLDCNDPAAGGRRCGNGIGLMGVCEGNTCHIPGCSTYADCEMFASEIGIWDSCRTITCLYGQCVDQFNTNGAPFDNRPGMTCAASNVADGICDGDGNCSVFVCTNDLDCPGYGLECGRLRCGSKNVCELVPHANGTPCTNGVCINAMCE